jgi:hypothetical protein
MRAAVLLGIAAMATTSCFAVTNLDRFHGAAGASGDYQDLAFTFRGATSHPTNLFEFRVIDANNIVQMRGVYMPLGGPSTSVNVPKAVPRVNGPYRLDFYADKNHSGGWDGLTAAADHDHGWRIEPLASTAAGGDPNVVTIVYDHNTSFAELNDWPAGTHNPPHDPGVAATLHFVNLDAFQGKFIQVRIADANSGHTAALYRVPAISAATLDGTVAGVIDPEVTYDVYVYLDANGNNVFDDPAKNAGDLGWKMSATATASGLTFTFDGNAPPAHADVGPP